MPPAILCFAMTMFSTFGVLKRERSFVTACTSEKSCLLGRDVGGIARMRKAVGAKLEYGFGFRSQY